MEFLHRLNSIVRLQVHDNGDIRLSGGDIPIRNFLKTLGVWSETEEEGFVVMVPAELAVIAQTLLASQKQRALYELSAGDIPLPSTAVSIHQQANGKVCVVGRPSPEIMIEMQQIGGEFCENIILGDEKLIGWTFNADLVDKLQELLSLSLSPYRSTIANNKAAPAPQVVASPALPRNVSHTSVILTRSRTAADAALASTGEKSLKIARTLRWVKCKRTLRSLVRSTKCVVLY